MAERDRGWHFTPEIDRMLRENRKLDAIKEIRSVLGLGLKDAKDLAEARQAYLEQRGRDGDDALPSHDPDPRTDLQLEVQHLLKQHKKIEAIKLVRSIHGTGLKEAKEWVETVERGEPAPSPDISINPPRPGPTVEEVALPLLQRGEKIEAIRAVRELTGLGLLECKALVERLQDGLPAQPAPPRPPPAPPAPIPSVEPPAPPGALPSPPRVSPPAPDAPPTPPRETPLADSPWTPLPEKKPWWKIW